ncbi:MAG: hypothetical protein V8R64_08805 [Thomasclavelia sp.]
MENLKSNIDHYMKLKGIRTYSRLLVVIAHELGIKGQKAFELLSNKEKSNFSKMLKKKDHLNMNLLFP